MIWIDVPDHRVEPTEVPNRVGVMDTRCAVCDGAVRTWPDGRFPIHAEPRPQRMEVPCDHRRVETDDDGLDRRFFTCSDCGIEVAPTEPDEDGESFWEAI